MAFDDLVVVVCMLDDKVKVKQAVYLIGKVIIGIAFFAS